MQAALSHPVPSERSRGGHGGHSQRLQTTQLRILRNRLTAFAQRLHSQRLHSQRLQTTQLRILRNMAMIHQRGLARRRDRHGRSSRGGISGMPSANSFASTGEACLYVFLCSCTVLVGTWRYRVVQCAKPKACRGAGHGLIRLPHKNLASDQHSCSALAHLTQRKPKSNTIQGILNGSPWSAAYARFVTKQATALRPLGKCLPALLQPGLVAQRPRCCPRQPNEHAQRVCRPWRCRRCRHCWVGGALLLQPRCLPRLSKVCAQRTLSALHEVHPQGPGTLAGG